MSLINGVATFTENSQNHGVVSTAFFIDSAENAGQVVNASFSNVATNTGVVTSAVFYTDSRNLNNVLSGTFYDSSINIGSVDENALFTNTSINSGSATHAMFVSDALNKGSVISGEYETPDQDQGVSQFSSIVTFPAPSYTNTFSGHVVVVLIKDHITSFKEPDTTVTGPEYSYDENGDLVTTMVVSSYLGETTYNNIATTYVYVGSSCLDAHYALNFNDQADLSAQLAPSNEFSDVFNTVGFRESFLQQISSGDTSPFNEYNIMLSGSVVDYDKYNEFLFDLYTNFCINSCFRSPYHTLLYVVTNDYASQAAAENENGTYSLTEAWPYYPANASIKLTVQNLLQSNNFASPLPAAPMSDEYILSGVDDPYYKVARIFAQQRTDAQGIAYTGELASIDDVVDGTLDFYYSLGNDVFGKLPKRSYRKNSINTSSTNIVLAGDCSQNAYPPDESGTVTTTFDGERQWTGNLTITIVSYVIEVDLDSLMYVQMNY